MAARTEDTSVVSPGIDFLVLGVVTVLLVVASGALVLL